MLPDPYLISDDRRLLDIDVIHRLLQSSYWANRRSREVVAESLEHSLCFGAYLQGEHRQVGFARVVTDRATFSWICDVIVDPAHRGKGLGKRLMAAALAHPWVKPTRCLLATRDAHGLYEPFGFVRREMMRRPGPEDLSA